MTETEHRIRRSTRYWKTARMKREKTGRFIRAGNRAAFLPSFPCLIAARIAADMWLIIWEIMNLGGGSIPGSIMYTRRSCSSTRS